MNGISNEIVTEREYWANRLSSRLDDEAFNKMAWIIKVGQSLCIGGGLELGCGESRLVSLIPGMIGMDYSDLGIRNAIRKSLPLVRADACAIPFASHSFDFVVTNSLHHMPYRRVIAEVWRVLKPNGVFYCFEPNRWHVYNLLFRKENGALIVGDRGFFPEGLAKVFVDSGFLLDEWHYIVLNMESIRLLSRVQRVAQRVPSRFSQAWFMLKVRKIS